MEVEEDKEVPTLVPAKIVDSFQYSLREKVPVTILTGFLGAGKSTLLGRILREKHGWRVAVIMNELGPSSNVDKALIWEKSQSVGEEWLEVENGCLCCTAKNETFLAVESLLLRRPDIEHIIIEASGAADPAVLVEKLWVDEALESRVSLDAVLCVIDCSTATKILSPTTTEHYSIEAARQVAIADCILLNKMDLICEREGEGEGEEKVSMIETLLKNINPFAKILKTEFSNAPLELILHLGAYYDCKGLTTRGGGDRDLRELLDRANRISLSSHHSTNIIRSFSVYLKHPVDLKRFEEWLFSMLWERRIGGGGGGGEQHYLGEDDQILRIKGILKLLIGGNSRPYALQVVQDKYELEPLTFWHNNCDSAIIFIGRLSETSESHIKSSLLAHQSIHS